MICFVGKIPGYDKKGKPCPVKREASRQIRNGNLIIDLPPSDEQKHGFTHEQANLLLSLYPSDYKLKVL